MDHIDAMDQLRDGIGLRAYGNRNPVTEYQIEGYDMFDEMVHLIREDTVRRMYQARINIPMQRKEVAKPQETNLEQAKAAADPPAPSARRSLSDATSPAPAEAARSIRTAAERIDRFPRFDQIKRM